MYPISCTNMAVSHGIWPAAVINDNSNHQTQCAHDIPEPSASRAWEESPWFEHPSHSEINGVPISRVAPSYVAPAYVTPSLWQSEFVGMPPASSLNAWPNLDPRATTSTHEPTPHTASRPRILSARSKTGKIRKRSSKIVTPKLLAELSALGSDGIQSEGGLRGVSEKRSVPFSILKSHFGADNTLNERGKAKINKHAKPKPKPAENRITPRLVSELSALGSDDIRSAGGIRGLAADYRVSFQGLQNYMKTNGTLTKKGRAMIDRLKDYA